MNILAVYRTNIPLVSIEETCQEIVLVTNVTIVIPVFGKPELVSRAISSVLEHGNLDINKLIVVNDAGPDTSRVREIVNHAISISRNIEYFENESNLGFGETCNRVVFELDHSTNDVLLLNSDAELTQGALLEMQSVLLISPHHACVSPRTNQGTISTVPFYPRSERNRDEAFRIFKENFSLLPRYSIAPVSPGFCMLIRRVVIHNHGLFDEIYSPGYDEENDFCMRVNSVGLSSLISNHAFVFHGSGQSFGNRREELSQKHSQILKKRFPFYPRLIERYISTGIDPVDKFLDYVAPQTCTSILVDCSALSKHLNGTSKNILSFLYFLETGANKISPESRFTILVNREISHYYELEKLGFEITHVEDGINELFDVGFALSPIWSIHTLDRLVNSCSRIAVLHLDIIAIRTLELSSNDFNRERAAYSAAEWADLTVFISNSSRQDFMHYRPSVEVRNAQVIHQGVITPSSNRIYKRSIREKLPSFRSSNLLSVLIVGNSFKHKQVDRAIESLSTGQFDVIALSGTTNLSGIVRTVRSGSLPEEYLEELFNTADVIVFPSAYEGFGLPVAEALNWKKPLVLFETNTAREIVEMLGGDSAVYFFSHFSQLALAVESAANLKMGNVPGMRTSDEFNAEVLREITALAAEPVDTDFLRQRALYFRELKKDDFSQYVSATLSRRSVRAASKIADVLWGPIYNRFFRK
jgi:GT2 family glycosyltransferase/glycosyltransferase involved in cell wall biosynthesis